MYKFLKLFKTKTFWVNLIMALIVIIPRVAEWPRLTMDPEMTALILFILNVILRWVTNKPLEER